MALETCFRTWALHAAPGSKDRLLVAGSSSSSFAPLKRTAVVAPLSTGRVAARRPRLVCQANNAVDEGNTLYLALMSYYYYIYMMM